MQDGNHSPGTKLESQKFLEVQFHALRTEIIENKRQNFQIIVFGVASLPVGDYVAKNFSRNFYIALPALVIIAALLYLGTNNAIIRCGAYIRRHIEPSTITGWEQWLELERGTRSSDKIVSIAIRLLFTIYLLIALLLARLEIIHLLPRFPRTALVLVIAYALFSLAFAYKLAYSFEIHTISKEEPGAKLHARLK